LLALVGMYPAIRSWPVLASTVVLDTRCPASVGTYKNRGIATTVKSAAAEKLPFVAVISVYPVWIVVTFPTTSMLAVNGLTLPHVT